MFYVSLLRFVVGLLIVGTRLIDDICVEVLIYRMRTIDKHKVLPF